MFLFGILSGAVRMLHYQIQGEGPPIVILHGLLGASGNWRSHAARLGQRWQVVTPDLRNHGASFHDPQMSYPDMAADVLALMDELDIGTALLVGHSMGGKVAMQVALSAPERVRALCVVDMAPVAYADRHSHILDALASLPLSHLHSRADANRLLVGHIPDRDVRIFALQNLVRTGHGWTWRCNLEALRANMEHLRDWPPQQRQYTGPALFMAGARSDYICTGDQNEIVTWFPNARGVRIANAGHWLHADQPERFLAHLVRFLESTPNP
jgi:esterase